MLSRRQLLWRAGTAGTSVLAAAALRPLESVADVLAGARERLTVVQAAVVTRLIQAFSADANAPALASAYASAFHRLGGERRQAVRATLNEVSAQLGAQSDNQAAVLSLLRSRVRPTKTSGASRPGDLTDVASHFLLDGNAPPPLLAMQVPLDRPDAPGVELILECSAIAAEALALDDPEHARAFVDLSLV